MPTLKNQKGGLNSFGNMVKQNITNRIVTPFNNALSRLVPKIQNKIKSSPSKSATRRKSPKYAALLEKCNSEKANLESYNEACHKTNKQLKQTHDQYKALAITQIDKLHSDFNKLKRVTKRTYNNKSKTRSNHSGLNNEMVKLKHQNERLKQDVKFLTERNYEFINTINELKGK
jgi:chromosome segregation ATPase